MVTKPPKPPNRPHPPFGSLPGEILPGVTWVNISKHKQFRLRQDPNYKKYWHSSHVDSRYYLTLCCLFKNLTDDEITTVVAMWSRFHDHEFDEEEFRAKGGDLWRAGMYAGRKLAEYQARVYWKELRRIASDRNAALHTRLRVSYVLNNREKATPREIHDATGIPLKTVQNCIRRLRTAGKVIEVGYGVYKVVKSDFWDRVWEVNPWGDLESDDAPVRCGLVPYNEVAIQDGTNRMEVYNYSTGCFETLMYDSVQGFMMEPDAVEWVIDEKGGVVANGTAGTFYSTFEPKGTLEGYRNGNPLDFRHENLIIKPFNKLHVVSMFSN
jgi:hypothetical protein